jgi:hypothetical protein
MAALTEQQRQAIRDTIMRDHHPLWTGVEGSKADLRAVIDAFDDYLETNASAINQTIPVGPRARFTSAQKARIMAYVALTRFAG